MTKEQLKDEMSYRVSISIVKKLLNKGLITKQEYKKIDTKLTKNYNPILGSLSA